MVWSDGLTTRLAAAVPADRRGVALAIVKTVHTAIFASVSSMILLILWDGITGRPRRRAVIAATVVLSESAIFISNERVCPLTPLAEQLGDGHGSVADTFLPDWISRRIPLIGGSTFALGVLLIARAARVRHRPRPPVGRLVGWTPFALGAR